MQIPLKITFHDVPKSKAVEQEIRDRVDHLERFHTAITSCRVTVEQPHRHKTKGKLYEIRIDVTVPGHELVVDGGSKLNHAHEDVYVAIRDAFNAAERQLQRGAQKQRRDVKAHSDSVAAGRVARIFLDSGYGFLESPDGREVYFHEHSVTDGKFHKLAVGATVRFSEEEGDEGPQAISVTPD